MCTDNKNLEFFLDLNDLENDSWMCDALNLFAKEVNFPAQKILELYGQDRYGEKNRLRLYTLLKLRENSIKLFSTIGPKKLSVLNDNYLLKALCAPNNIIQLFNAGIHLADINKLDDKQFIIFLNRSSNVQKLIAAKIDFYELCKLSLDELKFVLLYTDRFIHLINNNGITLEKLFKFENFEIDEQISTLKESIKKSFDNHYSIFKVPKIKEELEQPRQCLYFINPLFNKTI